MTYNTINNDVTIVGSADGALLAGRYRVVRQLGAGGMGSVWLAEDTQLDNKLFAVKMLPSILVANKRAYRQLKDEALVAMQLVHPNIVQIRAFEENNGNPFLVMDYIEGQTLDDYLAEHWDVSRRDAEAQSGRAGAPRPPQGGLPESDVIRILKPIAAALDYAHGEGVVHRDVKPANVMIRKDGHPFILDFGIAREIQETMTRVTGKLSSGTLLYMSPEQLDGDPPKKEQDIYSFAAMAYECLKGEPPFVRGAIEDQIRNKRPEPLRSDGALAVGIMAGLAKKPEDRPPSCIAVLEGDGFSRAEEVGSRVPRDRDGRATSLRSPVRNIARIAIPVACIAAALLIVGVVLWHRESRRQEDARRLAVEQQQAESRRRQAEDERKAQEAAARKKAEDERLAKLQQEDAQRKAKEEAERKAKEEAARIEAERKMKEEKAAAERKAREIAEREAEERRIAAEARAYTNCLVQIASLRREASNEYAKTSLVRQSSEGFAPRLVKIDKLWNVINDNSQADTLSGIQKTYTSTSNALWQIKEEVKWVIEHQFLRNNIQNRRDAAMTAIWQLQNDETLKTREWSVNPTYINATNRYATSVRHFTMGLLSESLAKNFSHVENEIEQVHKVFCKSCKGLKLIRIDDIKEKKSPSAAIHLKLIGVDNQGNRRYIDGWCKTNMSYTLDHYSAGDGYKCIVLKPRGISVSEIKYYVVKLCINDKTLSFAVHFKADTVLEKEVLISIN